MISEDQGDRTYEHWIVAATVLVGAGLAIAVVGRPVVAFAGVGILGLVVCQKRPVRAAYLFVVVLTIAPGQGLIPVGDEVKLTAVDLASAWLAIVWLHIGSARRHSVRETPFLGIMLLIVAVRFVSILIAPGYLGSGVLSALRFAEWLLVYLFFATTLDGPECKRLVWLFLILVALQSLLSLSQLSGSFVDQEAGLAKGGTLGSVGAPLAWLAGAGALIVLGMVRHRGVARPLVLYVLAAVMLVGLASTLSRTVWIATLLGLLFLSVGTSRRPGFERVTWVIAWAAVATVGMFALSWANTLETGVIQQRTQSIFNLDQNPSAQERFDLWRAGMAMFKSSPVLGIGAGNYVNRLKEFAPDAPDLTSHNAVVNVLSETGSVGFIAYLIFAFAAARFFFRVLLRESRNAVMSSGTVGLAAFLLASLAADWFGWASFLPWSAFLTGLLVSWTGRHGLPISGTTVTQGQRIAQAR